MEFTKWMSFTAMLLFTALTVPVQLAAQNSQHHPHQPHHYQLVDMGTFGGPQSYIADSGIPGRGRAVNNHGVFAGTADTSTPDPFPNFCFNSNCFVSHAFQWKEGAVTDLGTLPNGWSSAAVGVSANGLIAGFSQNGEIDPLAQGFPELRAVLWQNGVIRDLGTLPEGGYESVANAVNSRGQVVGAALNTIPEPYGQNLTITLNFVFGVTQVRAFLWQEGVMQDLGTLGGTDALAARINQHGEVVGWSYTSSAPGNCITPIALGSFIWEKGKGMRDLGSFGGTCTAAWGLNNRGQVVGFSKVAGDSYQRAFVWEHNSIHDLGGSFGGNNTGAFGINDRGHAVGFGNLAGETLFHAALWRQIGQMTDLGTVGGDLCSFAAEINVKGQVVGGSISDCGTETPGRAFLWEDGSIFDLNALIPPGSSLYLEDPDTINDRGEIAGTGADGSGDQHAFLLIPCDENHPGLEGCDYSPADAADATRVIPPPATQAVVSRTPMLNIPANRMLRPLGRHATSGAE